MDRLSRIKLPALNKTFTTPDTVADLIEFLDAVTDLVTRDSLSSVYKALTAFRKAYNHPFTLTEAYRILPTPLRHFKTAVAQDDPIRVIAPETVGWVTTSADPGDLRKYITRHLSQLKQGNIFCVQNVSGYTGFTATEIIAWVATNKTKLLSAAKNVDAAAALNTVLANLLKQVPKADDAIYVQERREAVTLTALHKPLAFIDFNDDGRGRTYTAAQATELLKRIESGYGKADTQVNRTLAQLRALKGKTVVMVGTPPTGWSTTKLQAEVASFGITLSKTFDLYTQAAFYNPTQTSGDKLRAAQQHGLTMLSYTDVLTALLAA